MKILQTAERVSDIDLSDNFVYQRSVLAYAEAAKLVSGRVLEIGTGSGYGIKIISPKVEQFITIDRYENERVQSLLQEYRNVEFIKMDIPPLQGIADNSVDFVITFQVIEHIEQDKDFVKEIHRILKPQGKLICTTPNKKMSLSRNPWHVREYTIGELQTLFKTFFSSVETLGVFGNEKVNDYYNKNRESVQKITRFDIFNLQYRLPRQLLQIPYDVLNRFNRKKLLQDNTSLVAQLRMEDFSVQTANDQCLDLFYIAEK